MLHDSIDVKGPDVPETGPDAVSWTCAAVTLAGYLLLMLGVAYAPALLAQPLVDGGMITVGLAGGVFAILLLIAVSAVYTRWRNKSER